MALPSTEGPSAVPGTVLMSGIRQVESGNRKRSQSGVERTQHQDQEATRQGTAYLNNPPRPGAKSMTNQSPAELTERRCEEQRIAQARQDVNLSITLHGGPWQECHELEQEQLAALFATEEEWLQMEERWDRHFALD